MTILTKLPGFMLDDTANFTFANVVVTGNISSNNANLGNSVTANYFVGDGSLLTGVSGTYSNANVANYLPTYTGNVSANYFIGNGSTLTDITGGNVTGQVGNALIAGTVYINAQPNITSVGTLDSLTVSGNSSFTGANTYFANLSNVIIPGGSANYVIATDGTGNLSWVAQSGGSGGTPGGSNTQIQYNDSGSFGGSSAFTFNEATNVVTILGNLTSTNANLGNLAVANYLTGTLTTGVQSNITSIGTLSSLTVSGMITATGTGVKTSNIYDSTSTLTIETRYGNVAGDAGVYGNLTVGTSGSGNITAYNANLGNLVIGNYIQGTLTTGIQPNITSVGTLSNLAVSGNVSLTGANVYVSNVANLKIPGGTSNYVLSTDGAGNLSWVAQSGGGGGGTPGGSNTQLQFNNLGNFGGTSGLTFDSSSNRLSITNYALVTNVLGNVSGNTTIDVNLGGYVTATVTGSVTWTFSNPAPNTNASGFILELTNGGSAAQIWPTSVKWPSGVAPTLTGTGVDLLAFVTDDNGTIWRGVATMIDSK